MNRETVLEQIHHKLQQADDNTLNDVLLLLGSDDTLDDWDKEIIADCDAGKFDDLVTQLRQNYADGRYEVLTDGLERTRKP